MTGIGAPTIRLLQMYLGDKDFVRGDSLRAAIRGVRPPSQDDYVHPRREAGSKGCS